MNLESRYWPERQTVVHVVRATSLKDGAEVLNRLATDWRPAKWRGGHDRFTIRVVLDGEQLHETAFWRRVCDAGHGSLCEQYVANLLDDEGHWWMDQQYRAGIFAVGGELESGGGNALAAFLRVSNEIGVDTAILDRLVGAQIGAHGLGLRVAMNLANWVSHSSCHQALLNAAHWEPEALLAPHTQELFWDVWWLGALDSPHQASSAHFTALAMTSKQGVYGEILDVCIDRGKPYGVDESELRAEIGAIAVPAPSWCADVRDGYQWLDAPEHTAIIELEACAVVIDASGLWIVDDDVPTASAPELADVVWFCGLEEALDAEVLDAWRLGFSRLALQLAALGEDGSAAAREAAISSRVAGLLDTHRPENFARVCYPMSEEVLRVSEAVGLGLAAADRLTEAFI